MDPVPRQKFGSHVGRESSGGVAIATSSPDTVDVGYQAYAAGEDANTAQNGLWGPTLPQPMRETLPFIPENAIFLGSPLGMFLTLRGAHPVFEQLRKEKVESILKDFEAEEVSTEVVRIEKSDSEEKGEVEIKSERPQPELPFASPFTLPVSGGVYNIFHPSDPVAYRIEPLLLPQEIDQKEVPPPVHLTVEGEGLRLHLKAQELSGEIAKVFTQWTSKLGQSNAEVTTRELNEPTVGPKIFPLGGKSQRVDFQLQRNVVDPEYLSAVTAHSTYFVNSDVQDFVMSLAAKAALPEKEEEPAALLASDPENHQLPVAVAEVVLSPST